MSATEHKRGGGPSGNRKQSAMKRAEIISMRIAGNTLETTAERVGLSLEGVRYHENAWLAERKPSVEVTEERRQQQLAAIDEVRRRCFAMLEAGEDVPVQLAVVDRIAKLWEREARLVGLDLERSVSVSVVPTAETLAALFGWDGSAPAIEGTAVEITDA